MAYEDYEICNLAGAKIGGFGDQLGATGQISDLDDTDAISVWCNTLYPKARLKVIIDQAVNRTPCPETVKYDELDDELTQNDVAIDDISVSGTTITVTTEDDHERDTGDTLVIKGVDGTNGIRSLNGITYTITKVDATSFTLDDYEGSEDWVYTDNSGLISEAPEMGPYTYAFDLPSACQHVVRVCDELFTNIEDTRYKHRFRVILNRDSDGKILLTNEVTNADGDGVYIEYVIDQDDTDLFSDEYVEALSTLLASKLCPVVGRNEEERLKLLNEYKNRCLPELAAYNQMQQNVVAKKRTDYRGGRNSELMSI